MDKKWDMGAAWAQRGTLGQHQQKRRAMDTAGDGQTPDKTDAMVGQWTRRGMDKAGDWQTQYAGVRQAIGTAGDRQTLPVN